MTESRFSRPTGRDVAARAGVSQSSVSLVISGKAAGRVSEEAQQRIREAARELGYRPHAAGSTLRGGTARTVGLVVPDVTNPFIGRVLRGAQEEARNVRYTVALIEPGRDRDWQLIALDALSAAAVDGLLLFVVEPPRGATPSGLGPTVMIDATRKGFPSVLLDIRGGADAVLQHLLDLGHRRIGHMAADVGTHTFKIRARAWRSALERAGVADEADALEVQRPFDLHAIRDGAEALLRQRPRPTALFCDDDLFAAAARLAAHDLGLDVPGQVSITGFAGTVLSEAATPRITTVEAPAERWGAVAMRTLLQSIRGEEPPARQILPVSLAIRASTGPAPA
jgi:DNA-binding LacI/PurR family transcriptional regulator